jgi:catalase
VAAGLGIEPMPAPMPKVLQTDVTPEVTSSPALSLFARPGDGAVRARRVAIFVADGVAGNELRALADRLAAAGVVARFVGPRLGTAESANGDPIEVDMPLASAPSVLFDGLVLPDGADAVQRLAADGRALEFLKDQYRHCKPILALGAGSGLLTKAGIPDALPSGQPDPGLVRGQTEGREEIAEVFLDALAKHRHFDRETDPPRV